jgi:hypothetical protein
MFRTNSSSILVFLLLLITLEKQFCRAWIFQSTCSSTSSSSLHPQICPSPPVSSGTIERCHFLTMGLASFCSINMVVLPQSARSAETVGKDPDCDERTCLGVWDGLLADCPHNMKYSDLLMRNGAGCTSSQDDTPGIFSEPWDYSEAPNSSLDYEFQMKVLRPAVEIVCGRRGDICQVLLQQGRYLRLLIEDGQSGEKSIAEFYFTPNDTTVQFRIGSLEPSSTGIGSFRRATSLRNIDRGEMIRKELRYLKIPVLRNRKRSLFFVESDLDSFGPGSAALGPPAEMGTGEIDGRFSDNVDPKLKIDLIQQFPLPMNR